MPTKPELDTEKVYAINQLVAKLRRLADSLEAGKAFEIQVAGERIYIPATAEFSIKHERSDDGEELEFGDIKINFAQSHSHYSTPFSLGKNLDAIYSC